MNENWSSAFQDGRDWLTPWLYASNTALIGIFLCIAQCAGASLGGMPCSVQDRVRKAPKETFCCKPVSARMLRPAIGGGVFIGIVTYSGCLAQQ